jgi:cytochrome c-type biogenesis protein CcmI
MELMGALLLVGVTVFFVLHPILSGRSAPLDAPEEELSEAQFRKRVSLLQLRDAEYEFAMGKLDEADFQTLKREISSEALAAIRAEEQEGAGFPSEGDRGKGADLEEEIARARAKIAAGYYCPQCGHGNLAGSRFCADCGGSLQDTLSTESN